MTEKLGEKYVSVRGERRKKLRDGKSMIVLCSLYTGGGVFV